MTYINIISGGGSNSGTSGGSTPMALSITNKTASFAVTAADDGKIFDNLGGSGSLFVTLPVTPVRGFTVGFLNSERMANCNFFLDFAGGNIRMPHLGSAPNLTCASSGRDSGCNLTIAYLQAGIWSWTGGYPFDWSGY